MLMSLRCLVLRGSLRMPVYPVIYYVIVLIVKDTALNRDYVAFV